ELAPQDQVGFLEDLLGVAVVGNQAHHVQEQPPLSLAQQTHKGLHAIGPRLAHGQLPPQSTVPVGRKLDGESRSCCVRPSCCTIRNQWLHAILSIRLYVPRVKGESCGISTKSASTAARRCASAPRA